MTIKTIKILLIEDSDDDALLLRKLITSDDRGLSFAVSHVQLLSKGLKELQEQHFDIVLVDLGLPDSQGIETAIRVRNQSEVVPIIVLTGFDDEKSALNALQMDIQDYLVKGEISGNMLVRSIRYAIGRKLAERRLAVQYAVVRLLAEAASPDEVLPGILKVVCEHVAWDLGEIWLVKAGSTRLHLHGVWHDPALNFNEFKGVNRVIEFRRGIGLPGHVWDSGKPEWVSDVPADPSYPRAIAALAAGLHGAFAFPIRSRGEIGGVMVFFSRKVQPRDEDLLKMFNALGSQIGDFLARKQVEDELKRYSAELERSNKDLQMFASIASHDLQEPLHTIGGFAALLEKKYTDRLDSKAVKFIGYILDGTSRMEQLIKDLLDYSRVSSGGKPFLPADCNAVLVTVLLNLKTAIDESGALISSSPLPTVTADESQLVHLFQNLIGNAIKYRKEKEPPRIHIHAERISSLAAGKGEMVAESFAVSSESIDPQLRKGKKWLFSVQDNGIGIAPSHFTRIFEAFQRLHKREEYPGTGIGLAICKKIVERHGGCIYVESEVGKGSTFFFALSEPAVEETSEDSTLTVINERPAAR